MLLIQAIYSILLLLLQLRPLASFLHHTIFLHPYKYQHKCKNKENILVEGSSHLFPLQSSTSIENYDPATSEIRQCAPSISANNDVDNSSDNNNEGVAIYVHIPYCRRRCRYCDFAIVPIGNQIKIDQRSISSDTSDNKAERGFMEMDRSYRQAILTEIELLSKSLGYNSKSDEKRIPIQSIYFGGGTPSLAPLETLEMILSSLLSSDGPFYIPTRTTTTMNDDTKPIEITIEMDPGTFTKSKLESLKQIGFNRISLGVQSFDDDILKAIGRVHRYSDIIDSVKMIGEVFGNGNNGGEMANYSIDLISGLPGLTLTKWIETLEIATSSISPLPLHLSLYDLQVESGTVFGKWYEDSLIDDGDDDDNEIGITFGATRERPNGGDVGIVPQSSSSDTKKPILLPLPSSEDCAFMYKFASGYLRSKGYDHYEISSYAKIVTTANSEKKIKGMSMRSRHNQRYWKIDAEWFALGLGATSCLQGKRFARPRQLADYIQWVVKENEKALTCNDDDDDNWIASWLPQQDEDQEENDLNNMLEVIMTRLRTKEGLDLEWIARKGEEGMIGNDLLENVLRGAELGFELNLVKRETEESERRDFLRLSDPDGFLFSNTIISSIFAEI